MRPTSSPSTGRRWSVSSRRSARTPCCLPWAARRRSTTALDLVREGVLEQYGVELIGASREAIDKAEDRDLFRQAMRRIGLDMPRSAIAHSLEEALQVQAQIGFPPSSGHPSPWAAAAAASPTTRRSSRRSAGAGSISRPPASC